MNNKDFNKINKLWISWHKVPRSKNICKYMNIPLYEYFINDSILKRHIFSAMWTIKMLFLKKPDVIFIHFSYLLLFEVVLYKKLRKQKTIIIADCHTKALRRTLQGLKNILFEKFKSYILRNSDLIIITNKGMIKDVIKYNNNYFILPDKIPDFKVSKVSKVSEKYCVNISSFSIDEPVQDIIEAAKLLEAKGIKIYWTGRKPEDLKVEATNIIFTGYLPYKEYLELISNASVLLVLSTEDDCLQCGAYEGLNATVPMVLPKTKVSRDFFQGSAVYCDINPNSIAEAVIYAIENREKIISISNKIKSVRNNEYKIYKKNLIMKIQNMV